MRDLAKFDRLSRKKGKERLGKIKYKVKKKLIQAYLLGCPCWSQVVEIGVEQGTPLKLYLNQGMFTMVIRVGAEKLVVVIKSSDLYTHRRPLIGDQ